MKRYASYLIHFNHNHDKFGRFAKGSNLPSIEYKNEVFKGRKARKANREDRKEIERATSELNKATTEYYKYQKKRDKKYPKQKKKEFYDRLMQYDLDRINYAQTRIDEAKKRIDMRYGRRQVYVVTYPRMKQDNQNEYSLQR